MMNEMVINVANTMAIDMLNSSSMINTWLILKMFNEMVINVAN